MNTSAAQLCSECDRDISFFFEDGEEPPEDALCPICHVQQGCGGVCGWTDEMTRQLNVRLVARLLVVFDMLEGLDDSLSIIGEMGMVATRPGSGLDVDLSEHHLTSDVVGRLQASGAELEGVQRALVRSLPEVALRHHSEFTYVMQHHPAGQYVRVEMTRQAL